VSEVCPKCKGVPCEPAIEAGIEDCKGCFECDFTGTLAGYELMQRMEREAYEAHEKYIKNGVCSGCGARTTEEAERKCRASRDCTDEWSCPGVGLWENGGAA